MFGSSVADDEGPHEGSLPSDEEMLSSPSVSGASSDDSGSSDDEGDDDEDVAVEQMAEQGLSASLSLASSGLVEMMINIVEKGWYICKSKDFQHPHPWHLLAWWR